MLILGLKRANLDQKGPKMDWARFFSRTPNLNFLREDHNISFYTKNQQNSTDCLVDISQNVDFGAKRGKFGPKRAQNGRGWIFPDCKHQFAKRRPEDKFLYKKSAKFNKPFGRYKLKCVDFGPKRDKFGPKRAQNGQG